MAQPKRLSTEKVARRILSRAKAQKAAQAQKEHQELLLNYENWKSNQVDLADDAATRINDFYAHQEVTKAFKDALCEIKEEQMQTVENIYPLYLKTGPVGLRSYVVEEF